MTMIRPGDEPEYTASAADFPSEHCALKNSFPLDALS